MKKNLRIVLGLVFLLYTSASCEPEDENNTLKTSVPSPIEISKKHELGFEPNTYGRDQIKDLSCDEIESTTLYAGQNRDVGWVRISNSEDMIFVTYDLNHTSWSLRETHLYVGSEEEIPYNGPGNPKIGHFQYHGLQDDTNNKEYTYAIPRNDEMDGCLVIIAHAVVHGDDPDQGEETAFGYGHDNEFPGGRWGWFIDFCLQECEESNESGDNQNNDVEFGDSGNGNSGNGDSGGNESGSDDFTNSSMDCLESFAFNAATPSDSVCFLTDGFNQWGWTNPVIYNFQMNYVTGHTLEFPLLASAYQCDIRNSLEVGYVLVTVKGGDGRFSADVEVVVTDRTYDLEDFDLYIGTEKYPLDGTLNPTVLPEFYTYHWSSLGVEKHSIDQVPWPAHANFIARASLCPSN